MFREVVRAMQQAMKEFHQAERRSCRSPFTNVCQIKSRAQTVVLHRKRTVNYDSLGQRTQLIQGPLKSSKLITGDRDFNTKPLIIWGNPSPFLHIFLPYVFQQQTETLF